MSLPSATKRSPEALTDNELVRRVLRGEVDAFASIVTRHQARLFRLGLKFLHRAEDAEDFAQEVFIRAYQRLATFQGQVPFAAWLYRISFNLAVNRYHVKKRTLPAVAEVEHLPDPSHSPEHRLVREELGEWVRKTLQKIPDIYNVLLRMHFFDGLSYPEISRKLRIPVNTIKSYIFRAKELIRQRLQAWEGEDADVSHG